VPAADPFALARRLLHVDPARTIAAPAERQTGERASFWVEDPAGPSAVQSGAVLRYAGEHAWIYVADRTAIDDAAIVHIGQVFDSETYARVTGQLGPPPSPGIDDDPRITILLADLHGLGGYFSSIDDEPASIERISNQRKMIYLDVSSAPPGSNAFDGNIAHEFQHLLHYARNSAAQAWINEGMSEIVRWQVTGSALNIPAYQSAPDTQLNDWPTLNGGSSLPHYGAAESFLRYLLGHYGGIDQAGKLAAEPGDGVAEIRAYLAGGAFGVSFEDVFAGWLVANLINDPTGGQFSQPDGRISPSAIEPLAVPSSIDATVHQFGARYYAVATASAAMTVDFAGAGQVAALPAVSERDSGVWWSRRGDSIDSMLTRSLDLTNVAHATLQFSIWYDTEPAYDFGYVEVSTDGGKTWDALQATHSTRDNPLGIALGPAYAGRSGGGATAAWVDETADLTPFAGRSILIRFEYVTDQSANDDGLAIANVRVPEIGFADPDASDPGWSPQGFARVGGDIPQRFIVQMVQMSPNGDPSIATVQRLQLDADNRGSVSVPAGVPRAVLIVSGATDLIRTPAAFHLDVRPG
jgi:immune inhibitor A